MFEFRKFRGWAVLISLTLIVSACGSGSSTTEQDASISTAVAQTVQAQNVQGIVPTIASPIWTDTPTPVISTDSLPVTLTSTPSSQSMAGLCSVGASLAGETIPDGTIIEPGETFTKIWHVQNTGTCTWDTNWQLVFYSGNQMDGLAVYNLPQPARAGQTLDIPIILRAPASNGTYTGKWILKTPWGETFGVGQYSAPITVSIVVGSTTPDNKNTATVYGVTNVTYQVDRRCDPANTVYTITAFITTNGPVQVVFTWVQSDGNNQRNNKLNFLEATTKSEQREWIQHSKNSSPNQRWVRVTVTSPTYQEFDQFVLPKLCGQE